MELLGTNYFDPIPTAYDKNSLAGGLGSGLNLNGTALPSATAPTAPMVPGPTPTPAPAPTVNPGPSTKSIIGWDSFLSRLATDNNLQTSLVQAGLQMMTPKGPNDNAASKILQGSQVGLEGYMQRRESGTAEDVRRAAIEQSQASAEASRVAAEGGRLDNDIARRTADDKVTQAGQETRANELSLTGAELDNKVKAVAAQFARQEAEAKLLGQAQDIKQSEAYVRYLDQNVADSQARLKIFEETGGVTPPQPSGNDLWAQRMAAAMYDPETQLKEYKAEYRRISQQFLHKKQLTKQDVFLEALLATPYMQIKDPNSEKARSYWARAQALADVWEQQTGGDAATPAASSGAVPGAGASSSIVPTPEEAAEIEKAVQVLVSQGQTPEQARQIITEKFNTLKAQSGAQ